MARTKTTFRRAQAQRAHRMGTQPPATQSAELPAAAPAMPPHEQCQDEAVTQHVYEAVTQCVDETVTQCVDETVAQGVDEAVTQCADGAVTQCVDEAATQCVDETVTQCADEAVTQCVDEAVTQCVDETHSNTPTSKPADIALTLETAAVQPVSSSTPRAVSAQQQHKKKRKVSSAE